MRAKLEAMGPVNMMALEEYKETAERHAFLETQRKDLISSIENTTATINEIDQISRQKFEEAFAKINENFQATFKKLFGGGHAFMKLTDEENSAESGIDVVASPPGKRLQSVLLLSGGEKASDGAGASGRHLPVRAEPVLHPGRSRRPARRSQHRTLHRTRQRDERARPSSCSSPTARKR